MRTFLTAVVLIALSGCTAEPTVDAGPRVDHWIQVLGDSDAGVRKEAAFKLGNLGMTDPETVVQALTRALQDADAAVRREAILALLKCGPDAETASDQLLELQRSDSDPKVRDYAGKALKKLNEAGS
jgi:HEAT repeat protein